LPQPQLLPQIRFILSFPRVPSGKGNIDSAPSLKILALEYINSTRFQVTDLALIVKTRHQWSEFLGSPSPDLCLIVSGVVLGDVEVEVKAELDHIRDIEGIIVKQCRIDSNI